MKLEIAAPDERERATIGKAWNPSTVVTFNGAKHRLGAGTTDAYTFVRDEEDPDAGVYVVTVNRDHDYVLIGLLHPDNRTETGHGMYDLAEPFEAHIEDTLLKLGHNVGSTDTVPERLWDMGSIDIVREYLTEGHIE